MDNEFEKESQKQLEEAMKFQKKVLDEGGIILKTIIKEKDKETTIINIKEANGKSYGSITMFDKNGIHTQAF